MRKPFLSEVDKDVLRAALVGLAVFALTIVIFFPVRHGMSMVEAFVRAMG